MGPLWGALRSRLHFGGARAAPKRRRVLSCWNQCQPFHTTPKPARNVRDRLETLLSASSPFPRQRDGLIHTLES